MALAKQMAYNTICMTHGARPISCLFFFVCYGFTNPRFHPECLQIFSSVVINGGGSWLQSSNWEFNLQSRFVMDCDASPFAIAVSDSPGVLEANGLCVASKTKRHDKPVYVQVSLIEFMGVKGRDKDFTPFKTCLQPRARAKGLGTPA
jgi:hypothetical protein